MKPIILFLTLAIAATLSGCDAATKGFNDGFDKEFRASCTKGATEKGMPADMSTKMCDCMMDDLAKHKTKGSVFVPSTEQITAAAKTCTANMSLPAAQ